MPGHVFIEGAGDYLGLEISWGLAFPIDLEFPVTYVIASEGYIRGLHYLEL
jgi:hypothetical protein